MLYSRFCPSRICFSTAALCCLLPCVSLSAAEQITWFGYTRAIEIRNDQVRVVLCPEVGGRVLEYALNGKNVLYVSEAERQWKPGDRPQASAGRFDIGPELVIPRREILWSGEWQSEITGKYSARLTSQTDPATGVQLIRDFQLDPASSHLSCTQTIVNKSETVKEWCHWSRTFAVGRGICVIPLTDEKTGPMSRFPEKYVMYEERGLIQTHPEDPMIRHVNHTLQIFPTPRKPKLGFDSYAGVIAYLAPNDLLFVKRFKTWPNRIYNEAAGLTISVWYPDNDMVELEPIGPRERLKPGESASFTEDWWLAEAPFPGTDKNVDPQQLQPHLDALQ
ncbi:MAG: hypothetical protein RIK87_04695 [Fuerstiella sp.]